MGAAIEGEEISTLEHVSRVESRGSHVKRRPGFLSVGSVDVLGQIILCYAAVLSIFSSIPRLYLLDARAPSSFLTIVTARSISRKCHVSTPRGWTKSNLSELRTISLENLLYNTLTQTFLTASIY